MKPKAANKERTVPKIFCHCARAIPVFKSTDGDWVYDCTCETCYAELLECKNQLVRENQELQRRLDANGLE